MEAVGERGNMKTAWFRVKGNKGAAGVDGMSVAAFSEIFPGRLGQKRSPNVGETDGAVSFGR